MLGIPSLSTLLLLVESNLLLSLLMNVIRGLNDMAGVAALIQGHEQYQPLIRHPYYNV